MGSLKWLSFYFPFPQARGGDYLKHQVCYKRLMYSIGLTTTLLSDSAMFHR